jgi:hypothetical protein
MVEGYAPRWHRAMKPDNLGLNIRDTRMSDIEADGRALAARAAGPGDLSPTEIYEFGSWLLDVMSRVIMAQDDRAVAGELRRLARQAFYLHVLSVEEQNRLGRWVIDDLDSLRQWNRRSTDKPASERTRGGRRASDVEAEMARAAHLKSVDTYFGISASLNDQGCAHGFKPAKSCPDAECAARRAQIAWDALA